MEANNAGIQWLVLSFEELTNHQLYALLQLRSEVFVVEQQCIFLDMDDVDQHCHHVLGYDDQKLVACTRLVPPDVVYPGMPSIGRVVTSPSARGKKLGRRLMEVSIDQVHSMYGNMIIKIGAQLYLEEFYASLGFVRCGDVYDEDGIDHIPMTLSVV